MLDKFLYHYSIRAENYNEGLATFHWILTNDDLPVIFDGKTIGKVKAIKFIKSKNNFIVTVEPIDFASINDFEKTSIIGIIPDENDNKVKYLYVK